ncbi:MAG TPA: sulfatase-like hydrolase/transferase [Burkholderiales bacterium]
MSAAGWRGFWSGPLALLFLTFPGVFLPLDMIWAGTGIAVYATWEQASRIFLYSAALAVLLSAIVCALVAWLPRRFQLLLCLTLSALAVLYSVLLWSQYYDYSLDHQWARQAAVVVLALAAGPVLARRLREQQLASLRSVMLAGTTVMALVALGCAALLVALSREEHIAGAAVQQTANRPPIFLITVDTLSAPYLSMYGYEHPTAPRLAEFAQGATVFLRTYANSNVTTPAVNSIMHGTRPWTHRAVHLEAKPLAAAKSLPALLRAAGYYTAAVSTNTWAAPRNLGITAHFSAVSENNVCAASDPASVLPPEAQIAIRGSLAWKNMNWLVVRAADWLGLCAGRHFDPELAFAEARGILARAPAGRPLFLWVHLFPPHDPYIAPAPFVGTFAPGPEARDRASTQPPEGYEARKHLDFPGLWRLRYQEAILYVDYHIGAFLDELKKTGLYERSLIIISADHGESFSKFYGRHGGPALHEELVRIPLLLKLPGQTSRRDLTQLSEQADLLPTILELAGVAPRPATEGISLVPALHGRPVERAVFSMNFQQSRRLGPLDTGSVAMLEGRWKYVHYFGKINYPHSPPLEDELYDLAADPHETANQVADQAELAERMRRRIEAELAHHGGRIE